MNVCPTTANDPFLTANSASSASTNGDASQSTIASDFGALTTAVQSGNATAAQKALAQLEQDSPTLAKVMQNSKSNSPLSKLASAVEGGTMDDAKTALSDLQAAMKARQQSEADDDSSDSDSLASSSSSAIAPDGTGTVINVSA